MFCHSEQTRYESSEESQIWTSKKVNKVLWILLPKPWEFLPFELQECNVIQSRSLGSRKASQVYASCSFYHSFCRRVPVLCSYALKMKSCLKTCLSKCEFFSFSLQTVNGSPKNQGVFFCNFFGQAKKLAKFYGFFFRSLGSSSLLNNRNTMSFSPESSGAVQQKNVLSFSPEASEAVKHLKFVTLLLLGIKLEKAL